MYVPDFRSRVQFTRKNSWHHLLYTSLPTPLFNTTYCNREVVFSSIGYVDNLANNLPRCGRHPHGRGSNKWCLWSLDVPGVNICEFRGSSAITNLFTILHAMRTRAERESAKAGPSPIITNRNAHTPHPSCVIHQSIVRFATLLCLALDA